MSKVAEDYYENMFCTILVENRAVVPGDDDMVFVDIDLDYAKTITWSWLTKLKAAISEKSQSDRIKHRKLERALDDILDEFVV